MPELADTLVATENDRLEQAEALVRGFCGWHIAPEQTDTVTLRARGGSTLFLPSLYVTGVVLVTDDTTDLTVETDYTWSSAGILTHTGYWGAGTVVTVEFTHGYLTVPADVTSVVQAITQRSIDNPGSLVRKTEGPFTEVYSTNENAEFSPLTLLESERDILRRYRIPAVA